MDWMALKYNQTAARINGTVGAFQRDGGDRGGGELVEVLPRRSQKVVLRLSPLDRTVCSQISKHWLRASRWRRPLASSRSEFVMEPCELSAITSQEEIKSGRRCHHARGCVEVKPAQGARCGPGNQIPPAPNPEASWCPSATGRRGTTSAIQVGRVLMFSCIHRKSSRAWQTPLSSARCPPVFKVSAFCMVLKMLHEPGSARYIEWSSPRTLCHFLMLIQRCVGGILSRVSQRRSTR